MIMAGGLDTKVGLNMGLPMVWLGNMGKMVIYFIRDYFGRG